MKTLESYVFQFPFYAIAYGSNYANELDSVCGFDDEQSAIDFVTTENAKILDEQYDNNEDDWKNDGNAVEWLLFTPNQIHELSVDNEYFQAAVRFDCFEGRHFTMSLEKFIKLAFDTQKSFAQAQSVMPAQVTQWIKKGCFATFNGEAWEIVSSRRVIKY